MNRCTSLMRVKFSSFLWLLIQTLNTERLQSSRKDCTEGQINIRSLYTFFAKNMCHEPKIVSREPKNVCHEPKSLCREPKNLCREPKNVCHEPKMCAMNRKKCLMVSWKIGLKSKNILVLRWHFGKDAYIRRGWFKLLYTVRHVVSTASKLKGHAVAQTVSRRRLTAELQVRS
jgi:hypothetical protein